MLAFRITKNSVVLALALSGEQIIFDPDVVEYFVYYDEEEEFEIMTKEVYEQSFTSRRTHRLTLHIT